jgi:hypothetical protein
LAGEDEIALMLVTLFRKGAVDEARRPVSTPEEKCIGFPEQ